MLFGANAGSAWAVDLQGPVTESQTGEMEYHITASTGNGVEAVVNAPDSGAGQGGSVIIGGDSTQNITINAENSHGIYAYGDVDAEVDRTITSDNAAGGEIMESTIGAANPSVTLISGQDNVITGGLAGIHAESQIDAEATTSINVLYDDDLLSVEPTMAVSTIAMASSNPSVTLIAGQDNVVTGGSYGIYSDSTITATTNATAVIQDDDDFEEATATAAAAVDSSREITLTAGQDNIVSGGDSALYSSAELFGAYALAGASVNTGATTSASAGVAVIESSLVTLEAGRDNVLTGGAKGIYSSAYAGIDADERENIDNAQLGGAATAEADFADINVSSIVTLTADQDNSVSGDEYGIHSLASLITDSGDDDDDYDDDDDDGDDSGYDGTVPDIRSKVALAAGQDNTVTGGIYGIYSEASGLNLAASEVTLSAGRDNMVTGEETALYSYGDEGASSVALTAGQDNYVTGGDYGVYSYGRNGSSTVAIAADRDNAVTSELYAIYSEGNSSVTLTAGQNNYVTGGELGVYSYETLGEMGIYSFGNGGSSSVTLTAGGDNIVEGANKGLYSIGDYNGISTVKLIAEGSNVVTGGDAEHAQNLGIYSLGYGGSSTVELIAGEDNIVTGGNAVADDASDNIGIYSRGKGSSGSSSVTLTAQGSNLVSSGSNALVSYGDLGSSSVKLEAGEDNVLTGGNYGLFSNAGAGSAAVELIAGGDNAVTGGEYGINSDGTRGESVISLTAGGSNDIAGNYAIAAYSSTVTLTAEQDNTITGGEYGIYLYDNVEDTISAVITQRVGDISRSYTTTANGGTYSNHSVNLTAEQDNLVTSDNVAIYLYGHATADATASIENGSALQTGSATATASAGANPSVTLTAGRNNIVVGGQVGLYSDGYAEGHVNASIEPGEAFQSGSATATANASTTRNVTLTAGQYNVVSGADYGIYSSAGNSLSVDMTLTAEGSGSASGAASGFAEPSGSSTITLDAGAMNIISASGTAIYSEGDGSSVNIYGVTQLSGANGALALAGGQINFNDGLQTLSPSTLVATDGGAVYVYDSDNSVSYIGTTEVDDIEQSTLYMELNAGSAWYLTGHSSASTLVNDGLLDMTADGGAFSVLGLGSLSGDGLIGMDIGADGSAIYNNSDLIGVDGSFTGQQSVLLAPTAGASVSPDAVGTVLLIAGSGDGTLTVEDLEGGIFWQSFEVGQRDVTDPDLWGGEDGTEFYLAAVTNADPDEQETTTASSVMSGASLNYHSWLRQNTTLLQRMGDLRQGLDNEDHYGAWFRVSGSKLELGGNHGFKNEYTQYDIGLDRVLSQNSKYTMYGGFAFSYADGDSSYRRGSGDNESKAFSYYMSQINRGGSYFDLVFKVGQWQNDFAVYDTYGSRIYGETESTGLSISAEVGKKFALNSKGFYLEPQAQLTYGHLTGDNYRTSNGVDVHSDGIDSLVGRVGVNLGMDLNPNANVYLKANLLHEFLGDYAITMSDSSGSLYRSGDYSDSWFTYGLGAAFKFGGGNFLHLDVERSSGGDVDQEWYYKAGFRFTM